MSNQKESKYKQAMKALEESRTQAIKDYKDTLKEVEN